MGQEVALAFSLWLDGLDAFEDFWDRRRWGPMLDPHLRLGFLTAMVLTVLLWFAAWTWAPSRTEAWMVGGSLVGLVVWFAVAAVSRRKAT